MLFSKELLDQLGSGVELTVDNQGVTVERDLQLATVLLLLQLGQIDDELDPGEINALVGSVGKAFVMDDHHVGELLEVANIVKKTEGALADAVELVNKSFDPQQKEELLAMVWRVILADGVADAIEARFAALLRERLGLGLDAAIRARQKAES